MSNPGTLTRVIELLHAAKLEPARLPEAIKALQAMVWKSQGWDSDVPADVVQVLRDLAYETSIPSPEIGRAHV